MRGFLTGNVAATGRGADWDRIRPTLRGSGRVAIANGKLVGVNIVADALNAVAKAPGVSQIVNVAFMSSHHGLLVDPDTELQAASMTFQQEGPRFTTHDLFAQSPDYAITGDGWFDMDKNIDMKSDIQLTLGLQVAIPVTVAGSCQGCGCCRTCQLWRSAWRWARLTRPATLSAVGLTRWARWSARRRRGRRFRRFRIRLMLSRNSCRKLARAASD